jgi:hypothetical protein
MNGSFTLWELTGIKNVREMVVYGKIWTKREEVEEASSFSLVTKRYEGELIKYVYEMGVACSTRVIREKYIQNFGRKT